MAEVTTSNMELCLWTDSRSVGKGKVSMQPREQQPRSEADSSGLTVMRHQTITEDRRAISAGALVFTADPQDYDSFTYLMR